MASTSFAPEPAGGPAAVPALIERFAAFGRLETGGITRLCASAEDGRARDLLASLLAQAGAELRVDAVGNQFGLFRLAEQPDAPLVMAGSHLDSQPKAGRFDGVAGVCAALEVGRRLMQERQAGARFTADFCAVNWTNEEGARFRPSLLGSGSFTGRIEPDEALACRDGDGITLGQSLSAIGYRGTAAPPPLPACYLELHVEQGESLERADKRLGVVTRNWGATKIEAAFIGAQAHTGPTPMASRRDALLAAAYVVADVRALADRWPGQLHTSVGRLVVSPNSANVVPDRTEFSIELRSADEAVLREAAALTETAIARAAERAQVRPEILARMLRPARALPSPVAELLLRCAKAADPAVAIADTVAGHDALSFLGVRPTGLLFVPSIGGIAHNEHEETAAADIVLGTRVLLSAAQALCRAGGDPERALGGFGDVS